MNIKCMTYDGMQMSVFLQSKCLTFTFYFVQQMYAPRITVIYVVKIKDLFDGIFTNLRIDMMDRHTIQGPI